MIPQKMFFTKGIGVHKDKLVSFENALRTAGIEKQNLVYISSIFPPNCKIISKKEGLKILQPGEITYCVMSKNETNEPNRLISAAIGLAVPTDSTTYSYLAEYHSFGEIAQKVGAYAENLAITMLTTTLEIDFDLNSALDKQRKIYKINGKIFKNTHIVQSAQGNKNGFWTTVIAAAVLIE